MRHAREPLLAKWIQAARPRTLPAAVVPVALGACSVHPRSINPLATTLAAVVALALQIATNYANDYSDGVKGTDEVRVGPFRMTASRLVPARKVRRAAFVWFGVAALVGLGLAALSSWWFIAIGASALLAGWFYTGGPKPYGYVGLGELFVMIYFGFVATVGTAFAQHHHIPTRAWWLGLAAGSMACALLEANNLRDADTDLGVGKKTLAARLGRRRGSWLYVACALGVGVGAGMAYRGAFVFALAYLVPIVTLVFSAKRGRELLPLLAQSAQIQLLSGLGLCVVLLAA